VLGRDKVWLWGAAGRQQRGKSKRDDLAAREGAIFDGLAHKAGREGSW